MFAPALNDVPVEYIMQQLHILAPHYWNNPDSADCTVVIPVPRHPSSPKSADIDSVPRITLPLHTEYLAANSAFLRDLLSGADPLHLVQNHCTARTPPSTPLRVPRDRLPRLLPSPPSHPIVFLPVPDPTSIQSLFYWMYFGTTDHLENALDQGDLLWEGLTRNVEYLGLSTDIKVFLGRWYRDNFLATRSRLDDSSYPSDEEDESDLDTDCGDYYSNSSDDEEMQCDDDSDCHRGRTRDVKPLVQLCGQLRLCTA